MPRKSQTGRASRFTRGSGVQKPTLTASSKPRVIKEAVGARKKVARAVAEPAKALNNASGNPLKAPSKPVANMTKKRTVPVDEETARPAKRSRPETPLNLSPTQKLDIYVFGQGGNGELGLGAKKVNNKSIKEILYPRLNTFLDASSVGVVQLAVGGMHCIALTHDQKLLTWGVNDGCALGRDTSWEAPTVEVDADSSDNDSEDDEDDDDSGMNPVESTPTALPAESFGSGVVFVQVVATNSASFALTENGNVWGWGSFRDSNGEFGFFKEDAMKPNKVGMNKTVHQKQPSLIPNLNKIKTLSAGGDHVLALDHSGKVWAWGVGEQSQLGFHIPHRLRYDYLIPSPVNLPKITTIAAGAYHSFAIDIKGRVWAWGLNNFGQAGVSNGAGEENALIRRPTIVKSLSAYAMKSIQGGTHHSIACATDGSTLVWGRCDDSQIGVEMGSLPNDDILFDSRGKPRILTKPAIVPGLHSTTVAAGIDNCIAVTTGGQAYSWGFSSGYRTGQGTENSVEKAKVIENSAVRGKPLSFGGCGGQFSVLAGPASS
ncbi:regulator of chromosome condensation 1/beta-lactamase-inhibitor protein II [Amylocarpus encephaloides]|uniref:Regulator of chromosome condensation 1/beta-lactamase-inhibitor protein II n=1 Tax=Amylocarpus encephaloides TaxID=45428 RepID=A0A9P7YDK8_9HELO|nr:regulator of chromosome condensation 1/beta-lactamase-inhibitor protein II [Amylocarpus encephaloides]